MRNVWIVGALIVGFVGCSSSDAGARSRLDLPRWQAPFASQRTALPLQQFEFGSAEIQALRAFTRMP